MLTSYKTNTHNPPAESLSLYLRDIGRVPLLNREQEVKLARRIRKGDPQARSVMIEANLRLVVKISRDYDGMGLPLTDLVNEGNIGLMKAVERFDPSRGTKLSTYAAWWIKQCVRRALANQTHTIRLPVHLGDTLRKLRRTEEKLMEQLGRDPTNTELSTALHASPSKIAQLRQLGIRPTSLNAPLPGDDHELGDLIEDESARTPHEIVRDESSYCHVRQLLKQLDPREAMILVERFGLDGENPRTLAQVGHHFRVSRERVRQIQNDALVKLRHMFEATPQPQAA